MIASALLLLVMVGLTTVFVGAYRYQRATTYLTEVQSQSLLATSAVTRELAESSAGSVRIDSAPMGIVFGSPRGVDGALLRDAEGNPLWRKLICFYLDTMNGIPVLVRKEELLASPDTNPPVVLPTQGTAYFQGLDVPREVVARHVTGFTVSGTNPVALEFEVSRSDGPRLFAITNQMRVLLRN